MKASRVIQQGQKTTLELFDISEKQLKQIERFLLKKMKISFWHINLTER
jgi:hypothetical protein